MTGAPLVMRPRLARRAGYGIGALVLGASLVSAVVIHSFDLTNRLMFVAFGLAVFWFCHREASVSLTLSDDRVVVRNLFSTRTLEWAEIVGISFPAGAPWAHLDLDDGDTLSVMALQRSDGEAGIADARRFAGMIREHGSPGPAPSGE